MRLPRDISGDKLAKYLVNLHYQITRQTGSHLQLTRHTESGDHRITIPKHENIRIGTLNNILKDVAGHLKTSKDELVSVLELE